MPQTLLIKALVNVKRLKSKASVTIHRPVFQKTNKNTSGSIAEKYIHRCKQYKFVIPIMLAAGSKLIAFLPLDCLHTGFRERSYNT